MMMQTFYIYVICTVFLTKLYFKVMRLISDATEVQLQ